MPNLLRQNVGSVQSVTTANAIASNAYAVSADKLTIDNGTSKALLVDFGLSFTFGAAPVKGAIQLIAVDWSLDGATAGPAPTSAMRGRLVGQFTPTPSTGNSSTSWVARITAVPQTFKTDYYLFNNDTGQSINLGATLRAQLWTPGTP